MSLPHCFVFNHVGDAISKSKQYNLSAIAVVRSLGRHKVPVVLLTTAKRDAAIESRYTTKVEICPFMHESEDALLEHLISVAKKYPDQKVLLPVVDECAYFTGKYYDNLSQYFSIPAPNWQAIRKINNKKYQYEAADELGIPIPETYFPKTLADVHELADKVTHYPYVIKPNVSFEWKLKAASNKAKGKKGIQVNNRAELLSCGEEIYVPGFDFMIQEVIGGRDERLVTFLGYLDRDHQPHSWFIRKKMRQNPIDFGYCTFTESCHNDTVFDQAARLLKKLNYHGIAGVEWKLDPDTDQYKLIEINGRPVNTTGCAIASGIDLPAIAYFDAINTPLAAATQWRDGERWAWLAMDFWAAREHIRLKNLTWGQWLKMAFSIRADAVFAWDDVGMSFRYYGLEIWTLLKNQLSKKFRNTR